MEQTYGTHLDGNKNAEKHMLLHYIKERCTILGTSIAIFTRYEYIKSAGNICHNHLIVAVDKSTMKNSTE